MHLWLEEIQMIILWDQPWNKKLQILIGLLSFAHQPYLHLHRPNMKKVIYLKFYIMQSVSNSQGMNLGCSIGFGITSSISSTQGIGLGRERLSYLTASLTSH